jgi:hypothetical protein
VRQASYEPTGSWGEPAETGFESGITMKDCA